MMLQYKYKFAVLTIFIIITFIIYSFNFCSKCVRELNKTSTTELIIPNTIHYIIFGKQSLEFPAYLSIVSSIKFQKPSIIYIHTNHTELNGLIWERLMKLNRTNPIILLNYMKCPTHVYGQRLNSIYHASDVARINVLEKWGGIYLDMDVVLLKNLDQFRRFEMVVGWPKNQYMGTQILLAQKHARFLTKWLEGYKRYIPTKWYYNAGQFPTEQILVKMPHLVHSVPELFGVQNLLHELYNTSNWNKWKQYYAIHLLSRHEPAPRYYNESFIHRTNTTFSQIVQYILST